MPSIGGSIWTAGFWTSPRLQYSLGSHVTARNNSWGTLTWSGAEPTDSTILLHVLNADNDTIITGLGSLPLGSSPVNMSGTSAISGLSLKIRFDAQWITGSPTIKFWTLDYVPTPIGNRKGTPVIQVSG